MLDREKAVEEVRAILVEQLGVDPAEVTVESSFQEDLNADSLDLVELIMEMEDRFKIKIPDEEAEKIATVGSGGGLRHGEQRLSDGGAAGSGLARLVAGLSAGRRRQVFTHSSWAPRREASYERLEFLGDSVLEVVVSEELMRRHPSVDEGELSWMRQVVVARDSCSAAAVAAGLPERSRRGRAGLPPRGRDRARHAPDRARGPRRGGHRGVVARPGRRTDRARRSSRPSRRPSTPPRRAPATPRRPSRSSSPGAAARPSPTRSSPPAGRRRTPPSPAASSWAATCSGRAPDAPSRPPSRPPPLGPSLRLSGGD